MALQRIRRSTRILNLRQNCNSTRSQQLSENHRICSSDIRSDPRKTKLNSPQPQNTKHRQRIQAGSRNEHEKNGEEETEMQPPFLSHSETEAKLCREFPETRNPSRRALSPSLLRRLSLFSHSLPRVALSLSSPSLSLSSPPHSLSLLAGAVWWWW
ncbi:hypothetical protein YC2023_024897 [Brassica napus]